MGSSFLFLLPIFFDISLFHAAKGIDLLQKRLDERDDLDHLNHIEPLQNIYASSLKGEVYQEPVVVPAQKVETGVSVKQEVSSEKTETALDYKSAVVQGALAVSVPVALNQAKQKVIPKPLPDAQSSMPMPPSPEDPEKKRGKQKAEVDLKEKAREILRESEELRELDSIVEELKKTTSDRKPGTHYGPEAGVAEAYKIEEKAEVAYGLIRECKTDIGKISSHTKVPEQILQQIKDHVFYTEHQLLSGMGRFDPNLDMAEAWMRLVSGDFLQSDLLLLEHEYSEHLLCSKGKIESRLAHSIVNGFYNWQDAIGA